jgi:fructokinase
MTHPSALCFGELLIDMIATNTGSLIRSDGFEKFGGAPANTACGLAKLGIPVSFMGKVGNDPFGHF